MHLRILTRFTIKWLTLLGQNVSEAFVARKRVNATCNISQAGLNLDIRPNLPALQIPCQPDVAKPSASSSLLPPLPTTKSGKFSGSHGQLPRSGLRSRASIEKNLNVYLTGTQRGSSESLQPTLPGLPLLPLWNKRTSSLPVRTNALNSGIDPDFNKGHSHDLGHNLNSEPGNGKVNIVRSFSTPVFVNKIESFRRNGSERKGYVLLRSVNPRIHRLQPSRENESVNHAISTLLDAEKGKGDTKEDVEEAIPEDEAVCRICMDSLTEDYGETLKMECLCLGEMALAHKECAFKWFGIKGDRVCDVCGSVVNNIPVTVVPFVVKETSSHSLSMEAQTVRRAVWQDVLIMGTINTMAHFCFIEQLLVYKLGTKALPISISFAFIIGFLAAVTTIALVSRRYIWLYAFVQFALLCFFGYIFFVKTELEAMPAILLAAFVSFGIAMTSNALILEFVHWRAGSVQSANSTMDVEASSRRETNDDIESGSANSRSSNSRRTAASGDQFLHES